MFILNNNNNNKNNNYNNTNNNKNLNLNVICRQSDIIKDWPQQNNALTLFHNPDGSFLL